MDTNYSTLSTMVHCVHLCLHIWVCLWKIRTAPKELMGPALPGAHISIFTSFRQAAHEEAELLDWIEATKAKRQAKDPDHTQNKSQGSENNGQTVSRCPRPAFCI